MMKLRLISYGDSIDEHQFRKKNSLMQSQILSTIQQSSFTLNKNKLPLEQIQESSHMDEEKKGETSNPAPPRQEPDKQPRKEPPGDDSSPTGPDLLYIELIKFENMQDILNQQLHLKYQTLYDIIELLLADLKQTVQTRQQKSHSVQFHFHTNLTASPGNSGNSNQLFNASSSQTNPNMSFSHIAGKGANANYLKPDQINPDVFSNIPGSQATRKDSTGQVSAPFYHIEDDIIYLRAQSSDNSSIYSVKVVMGKIKCKNAAAAKSSTHLKEQATHFEEKLLIVLIEDISDTYNVLTLKNQNMFKLKVLSTMSHELKTPLNCSLSVLELLQEKVSDPYLSKNYIQPSIYSSKLLLNLVNNMLDYVLIEQKKFNYLFKSFNVRELFEECVSMFRIQAEMKGLELCLDIDASIQSSLKSDQNRIRQVIITLLQNSLKYTSRGSITLKATKLALQQILIEIIDTGCGITPQRIQMIRHQFLLSLDQNFNGDIRLGLVISNILARGLQIKADAQKRESQMYIEITSQVNSGSKFSFVFDDFRAQKLPSKLYIEQQASKLHTEQQASKLSNAMFHASNHVSNQEEIPSQLSELDNKFKIPEVFRYNVASKYFDAGEQIHSEQQAAAKHISFNNFRPPTAESISPLLSHPHIQRLSQPLSASLQKSLNSDKSIPETPSRQVPLKIEAIRQLNISRKCKHPSILICDDTQFNILGLRLQLQNYQFVVEFANSGEEAIAMVKAYHHQAHACCPNYSLIFMVPHSLPPQPQLLLFEFSLPAPDLGRSALFFPAAAGSCINLLSDWHASACRDRAAPCLQIGYRHAREEWV